MEFFKKNKKTIIYASIAIALFGVYYWKKDKINAYLRAAWKKSTSGIKGISAPSFTDPNSPIQDADIVEVYQDGKPSRSENGGVFFDTASISESSEAYGTKDA